MIVYALSTGNKIGLGLIALAWIVFSLLAAMVIPRYRQNFPANVGGFLSVCAVFFAATLFAVFYFGKESHESEAAGHETTAQTTETQTTETQPGATTGATTTETQAGGATDLAAGKAVFEKAACGGCHVLADAGSKGAVGPDLDQLKPDEATVEHQVINGGGAMPAFKGVLTDTEIKAVATYVSQVAGKT